MGPLVQIYVASSALSFKVVTAFQDGKLCVLFYFFYYNFIIIAICYCALLVSNYFYDLTSTSLLKKLLCQLRGSLCCE